MSLVVLSTDTPHHRYFINRICMDNKIDCVYFETNHISPLFEVGPFMSEEENEFERRFFLDTPYDLDTEVRQAKSINSEVVVSELERLRPDIGLVFGTGIIKPSVINKFKCLINVHRGIIQNYRGLDSDLWAVYHGDFENIGTTIHLVDKRLDTGNIIDQGKVKITKDMCLFQLRYYTTLIATDLVIKALLKHKETKKVNSCPQTDLGRYYSFMPLVMKQGVNTKFNKYVGML